MHKRKERKRRATTFFIKIIGRKYQNRSNREKAI